MSISLQQRYARDSFCYGCGPANARGLQLESFAKEDFTEAFWTPSEHHNAFPGILCGGIIGTILDCHCNWTAAWALMNHHQLAEFPCTVTADYRIKMRRPTPMGVQLRLIGRCRNINSNNAIIDGELWAGDHKTATLDGKFVAVGESHPAHQRWKKGHSDNI